MRTPLLCLLAMPAMASPQLDKRVLPKGFHIAVYSGDVPDAWEIALGGASRVYALADTVRGTARRNPAIAR